MGGYGAPPGGGGYGPPPGGGGYGPPPQYPYGAPPGMPGMPGPPAPPQKKGMSAAAIVLIVIAVFMAMGGGGCALCICLGVKGAEEAKEKADNDRKNAAKLPIDTLLSAYKANEVRADATYKNHYYALQGGQIGDVKKSIGDSMYLTLGTGKAFEIPMVQCMLRSDQTSKASQLAKGRHVAVRGKVTGLFINVTLEDCEIL